MIGLWCYISHTYDKSDNCLARITHIIFWYILRLWVTGRMNVFLIKPMRTKGDAQSYNNSKKTHVHCTHVSLSSLSLTSRATKDHVFSFLTLYFAYHVMSIIMWMAIVSLHNKTTENVLCLTIFICIWHFTSYQ